MRQDSEPERFVLCSERVVLECKCGEMLVLLGFEDDWYSEGRTVFECDCGEKLTLAHRFYEEEPTFVDGLGEETNGVRELLRNLRDDPGT